jgi:hypothetical protein
MEPSEYHRILGEIARQGLPIRLYNTYRGLPISFEARLLDVSLWYATALVHEFHAVCLSLEGYTYIESDRLPEVLRARSLSLDIQTREVRLSEFVGVGHTVGKRSNVRVQPHEPTDVEIYDVTRRVPGILADVSPDGIGVVTFAAHIYGQMPLTKGSDVDVDLRMPGSQEMLSFAARVAAIQSKGKYTHRLGLKLAPDEPAAAILSSYVAQRQEIIMVELNGVYNSMRQAK